MNEAMKITVDSKLIVGREISHPKRKNKKDVFFCTGDASGLNNSLKINYFFFKKDNFKFIK